MLTHLGKMNVSVHLIKILTAILSDLDSVLFRLKCVKR